MVHHLSEYYSMKEEGTKERKKRRKEGRQAGRLSQDTKL
jgi:hypothetical protein